MSDNLITETDAQEEIMHSMMDRLESLSAHNRCAKGIMEAIQKSSLAYEVSMFAGLPMDTSSINDSDFLAMVCNGCAEWDI